MPPKPSDPHEIEQEQKDHENYEVTEDILNEIEKDCPPVRHVKIWLCQSCLDGQGDECHTPGCALCFNRCPDMPIAPELYEIVEDMSDEETE